MLSILLSSIRTPQVNEAQNTINQQYDNSSMGSNDVSSCVSTSSAKSAGCYGSKSDIYVCTFCQVFSPDLSTVSNHISTVHSEALPMGTKPENFVSKLQPLEGNSQKKSRKVGRPRKKQEERITHTEPKQKIVNPVPDSNGLFWCKSCLRYFKKPRQLIQHICISEEEDFSEESSLEMDTDVEFKTHMSIDPTPWCRRKRVRTLKENATDVVSCEVKTLQNSVPEADNSLTESKTVPNWRNDPAYVPLFDDEKEKAAFEEHLKSIDYSYVDGLFQVLEKGCRNKTKSNCLYVQSVVYCCNVCKKNFKSLSIVRLHCLTHTDIKPFTCPKCPYKSNSPGSLYMHMRIHTGNVFHCSFCDFTCIKRSHLLDHEATHSTVYQTCKLCKNSYKTVRSLVAHVRKYHNYPGGKKYLKSLTCKESKEFKCDICNKKFKSLIILNNHNHACHETFPSDTHIDQNVSEQNLAEAHHEIEMNGGGDLQLPGTDISCADSQTKDSLAEMVLNNFLQQQQQSEAMMYQNVFDPTNESIMYSQKDNLLDSFQAKSVADRLASESSILEECQKTLDLDILKECLQNTGFSNKCQEFSLMPNIPRKHSLQDNSENIPNVTSQPSDISDGKLEEPKSVEIKLFEKCQRAPAYVCCVCSAIYICPATLKAHLREHVNSTNSSFIEQSEEQFEPTKIAETNDDLDVCQILQDSSESCSYDEELEKLYMSSLDMMYYLPEVSVVLENDPALFDSVLEDISNFPIADQSSQDLTTKDPAESVLKCFSEI